MEDLISVVVPVYNVEKYIRKCIDSILEQTYTNLQIILIDDGSTDNSGKICDEYSEKDKRINVIHKKNSGVSAARNTGIQNAIGDWILFVDSDDWIELDCCKEMLLTALEEKSDCVICKCNKVHNEEVNKFEYDNKKEIYGSREFLIKVLNVQSGYGFCHSKLIKREIIKEILFDTQLKVGEDALFNIHIAQNMNKIVFIENPLYNYRINAESVVRRYDTEYLNKYRKAMQKAKEYLLEKYENDKIVNQNIHNYIMYHLLLILVNYCCNSENNLGIISQIKLLREICNIEEFKEALKKSNYKELSLTRKIALFTLKYKIYIIAIIIGKIRRRQI